MSAEQATEVQAWEGRALIHIATLIRRYLHEVPCPGPSRHVELYDQWATDLAESGAARLAESGERRLSGVV